MFACMTIFVWKFNEKQGSINTFLNQGEIRESYEQFTPILWPCVMGMTPEQKLAQGKCSFLCKGFSGMVFLQDEGP